MLVAGVLLCSLVLMQAPALFGEEPPLAAYGLALVPFAAALASLLTWRAKWWASRCSLLAAAYVALLGVAAVRGAAAGAMSWNAAALEVLQFSLLAAVAAAAFLREPRAAMRARYLRALCWAPTTFLATNVLVHVVAPGDAASSYLPATMLGYLGVTSDRVTFPMSGGLNGIGPTAAAAFVISVVFALRCERRGLSVASALLAAGVILAIDSRGALLFAGLALAIVVFTPRARKRGLGWVAVLLPILPVVLVLVLTGLAETDAGSSLSRDNEGLSTGTGRTVVWDAVARVLAEPRAESVVGYGQYGQLTSGASLDYAYLFSGEGEDSLRHTAHSLVLQTALDTGWLGALLLVGLAAAVLVRLGRRAADPYYEALAAAVLALLLLGLVQADPTPAHPDSFAFWVLVVFAASRARSAAEPVDGHVGDVQRTAGQAG